MRHTQYLLKGDSKIADVGEYSFSPDDRYIAYQEGSTAKVFLLDQETGQIREMTPGASGLVRAYDWRRETGYLWLDRQDGHSIRLKIPEFKK
jgi:Tol biopolymer transport system component